MAVKIDKDFAALIPPLAAEERAQLEANIVEHGGARDPLVAWQSGRKQVLLDGHNRHEICTRLKLPFDVELKEFEDRSQAEEWIIRNQFGRRNLSPYVRTQLALRLEETIAARAKVRREETQGRPPKGIEKLVQDCAPVSKTRQEVAKVANVSHGTVDRVKKINEAEKAGKVDAETIADLRSGNVSINKVFSELKKEENRAAREKARQEVEKAAKAKSAKKCKAGDTWQLGDHLLYCGDTSSDAFKDLLKDRASLAFADPPYGANVSGYDDSKFYWEHDYLIDAADVVVVTPGIVSIFEFAGITEMPYQWSLAAWITNGMTRGAVGFGNWLYAAVFSHGSVFRQAQDFCRVTISNSETEDTAHPTRKPTEYVQWVVETFTREKQTVVDPFLGSGQTLVVCQATGRKCIGGELDPKFCSGIVARWESMTGKEAVRV